MSRIAERELEHDDRIDIPKFVLRAAMALVLFSVAAVLIGRYTERGLVLTPPADPAEIRMLAFETAPAAGLIVRDAESGAVIETFDEAGGGFVRGVLRGLSRGRALSRAEPAEVYALTRWEDGRLSLGDPATGNRFDLNSFGSDNLATFAAFLKSREETR